MNVGRLVTVAAFLVFVAGCTDAEPAATTSITAAPTTRTATPTTSPAPTTGTYPPAETGTFPGELVWRDQQRFFLLTVPEGYDPAVPAPLIVSLHSERETAAFHAVGTGMADGGAARGYVVVHPQAVGPFQEWDPQSGSDDIAFLNLLLAQVRSNLNIGDVFLVGMSNGAGLAHRYACEGDGIAAIVGIAGLYADPEPCEPAESVAVLAVHSALDVSPFLPTVDEWAAGWAARDGCIGEPVVESTAQSTITRWPDCFAGTSVTLYTLGRGGHSWPASIYRADASVVTTTELILDWLDASFGTDDPAP